MGAPRHGFVDLILLAEDGLSTVWWRMLAKVQGYVNRVKRIVNHPANAEAPFSALGRALHWRAHLLVRRQPLVVTVFDGLTFRADNTGISRSVIYHTPWFEYDEMHFVSSYLRPGDNMLDVGANAGIYSLLASTVLNGKGRIDAIEPVPGTLARLKANIEANGLTSLVQLHNVAVAEVEGTVQMTADRDTVNHIVPTGGGISVPAIRLEQFTRERHYAFAKMDVEGMELPALRGAGPSASEGNPAIWMIEVNGSLHRYGFTVPQVVEWAERAGYQIAMYDHKKRQLSFPDTVWGNLFLIHRTAWPVLRERMPWLAVPQAT